MSRVQFGETDERSVRADKCPQSHVAVRVTARDAASLSNSFLPRAKMQAPPRSLNIQIARGKGPKRAATPRKDNVMLASFRCCLVA
jgi:hypothetical protein